MAAEQTYLTPDGLRQTEEELDHLRSVRRPEVADHIQEAKGVGGTLDNAEYEEARNEQGFIEGRIQELEAMVYSAVIIPDHRRSAAKSEVVELGSIIKVQSLATNKRQTYTIVGSAEASPETGRISNESPLGEALMGKRAGDEVEFTVPAGIQRIKVLEVR